MRERLVEVLLCARSGRTSRSSAAPARNVSPTGLTGSATGRTELREQHAIYAVGRHRRIAWRR